MSFFVFESCKVISDVSIMMAVIQTFPCLALVFFEPLHAAGYTLCSPFASHV